jgi:hypothetical protein
VWDTKVFFVLEEITVDGGLVQEAPESDATSRLCVGSVSNRVVKFLQAGWSDRGRACSIDSSLGRGFILLDASSCWYLWRVSHRSLHAGIWRTYRRHCLAQEHRRINEVDVIRQSRRNRVLRRTDLRDAGSRIFELHERRIQERVCRPDCGCKSNVGAIC